MESITGTPVGMEELRGEGRIYLKSKHSQASPPDLCEYSIDDSWFKAARLEQEIINLPLRGSQRAVVVIIEGTLLALIQAIQITRAELVDIVCVAEKIENQGLQRVFEKQGSL